jgi:hypothetical protein
MLETMPPYSHTYVKVSLESTTESSNAYGIRRGLKSHHIQLLAISGVIGTGLFVGTSSVLNSAGPAGLLIGYSVWYENECSNECQVYCANMSFVSKQVHFASLCSSCDGRNVCISPRPRVFCYA